MNILNHNFLSKTALLATIFVISNILISCKELGLNRKSKDANQSEHSMASTKIFVNSPNNIRGNAGKQKAYVDFSFKYPDTWRIVPPENANDNSNYVKVERSTTEGTTIENFAVGSFEGKDIDNVEGKNLDKVEGNEDYFKIMVNELSRQFSLAVPGYIKKSEGKTKIGLYNGYELRFVGTLNELELWGRVVLVPDGTGKGATLVMLASSRSTEVKSVEDVGVKGELPIILNSFKFTSASEKK
jgi:hypothetical protein